MRTSAFGNTARRLGRVLRPARQGWKRGIPAEMSFWREFFATKGARWPAEYTQRLDARSPIEDPLLAECIGELEGGSIKLLDVGAGPVTSVGYTWPGRILEITAVDPLAEDYGRLLEEFGVVPPVTTVPGSAEELLDQFAPDSFDVAYARNCLDHGIDPVHGIENMVRVVRPGGYVVLRHAMHEAVTQGYRGLHGWNFEHRAGELYVWRRSPRLARNVTRHVAGLADGSCVQDGYAVVASFRRH